MRFIYDLDGTVINSSHRTRALPSGQNDLEYWRANCTPEQIAKDTPTVLAHILREHYEMGHTVILCTSRIMGPADYRWLSEHRIPYHACLDRPPVMDNMPCGYLKLSRLYALAESLGYTWEAFCKDAMMIDDSRDVINTLGAAGLLVLHPSAFVFDERIHA